MAGVLNGGIGIALRVGGNVLRVGGNEGVESNTSAKVSGAVLTSFQ